MALIYGKDFNNKLIPVAVTPDGELLFDPVSITLSGEPLTVDPSGALYVIGKENSYLNPGAVSVFFSNTALPAGTSTQILSTVTSGQTWRLTFISVYYIGTVAGVTLTTRIYDGSNNHRILYTAPPVSNVPVTLPLDIIVNSGNRIETVVTGATLNDDLVGSIFGQRIG